MSLQVVGTYLQIMEAEAVCAALTAAGFRAVVLDRELANNVPYLTQRGVRVAVPESELKSAVAYLAHLEPHQPEELDEEDQIRPTSDGRGWLLWATLAVLTMAALWRLGQWLLVPEAARITPAWTHWLAALLLAGAAAGYAVAAQRAHGARRGATAAWAMGWLSAITAEAFYFQRLQALGALYDDTYGAWTFADIFNGFIFGHMAVLLFGVVLWRVEEKERWGQAPDAAEAFG